MRDLMSFWISVLAFVTLSLTPFVSEAAPPLLIEVHTAAPALLVATVSSTDVESGSGTVPTAIDIAPAHWTVNGVVPVSTSLYAVPYDETPAVNGNYPVTVHTRVYLRIPQAVTDGSIYTVASPYGNSTMTFWGRVTWNESIKVNQVAYSGASTVRFANVGVYTGASGSLQFTDPLSYDVLNEATGQVVYSGKSTLSFNDTPIGTGPTSGEWVYRLPLQAVQKGGPYFISVAGFGRSRSFSIGGAAYQRLASDAFRALYHQRCGIALTTPYTTFTRGICHSMLADMRLPLDQNFDPANGYGAHVPAGIATKPMAGGWHDAGNFQKRPQHVFVPIDLMAFYEAFPSLFTDGQYNLPESGNGIPDILDEAMWGVKLYENLQVMGASDPLRGCIEGGAMEDHQPTYGVENAATSPQIQGSFQVTEYTTTYGAGILAQASRLIRPYDSAHADALLERARNAWDCLSRGAINATPVTTPATRYMYPSLQIYLATGDQSFHTTFKNAATAILVSRIAGRDDTAGTWPEVYLAGNYGISGAQCQEAHFISYLVSHAQPTDSALVTALQTRILHEADNGGFMSVSPSTMAYPVMATKYYGWGATTAARYVAPTFATLFTTDSTKRQGYVNTMALLMDGVLGLNAMGVSYMTGEGTDSVKSPLHLDSWYTEQRGLGPVPGITIFGPGDNSGAYYQLAVWGKLSPAFDSLPVYRKWADGWSNVNQSEFGVSETVIQNALALAWVEGQSAAPIPMPSVDAGVSDASLADAFVADVLTDSGAGADVVSRSDTGADVLADIAAPIFCIQPPAVCGPLAP